MNMRMAGFPGVRLIGVAFLLALFWLGEAQAATSSDLGITKTGPASVNIGSTFQYAISVKNIGNDKLDDNTIKVADTLPAALIFASAAGTNWACTFASGTVNCTYKKSLRKGKTAPDITLTVTAPATPTIVTNTATVSAIDNIDPKPGNNSSSVTTQIVNPNPGFFNIYESDTASGAVLGPIRTKVAGSGYSLDVVALNATRTAIDTTFSGTVKVEVLDAKDNSGTLDTSTNCRTSWTTVLSSFTASINGGRSTVGFPAVANVYRDVRVRVTDQGNASRLGCSTNNFAIRPYQFNVSVSDADWQTAGTTRTLNNTAVSGGVTHKAGQPFTLIASAVNANGVATSNYTNSAFYTGMPNTDVAAVLQPAGGVAGVADPGTMAATGSAGQVRSDDASYDEVGVITLLVFDDNFAAVDAGDTPLGGLRIQGTFDTGRFVPNHFDVTTSNTPVFKTFNDTACASRSFTYIGQPFGYVTAPQALITAREAGGTVTQNYSGALWRPTPAYAYTSASGTLDTSLTTPPVIAPNNDGTGSATVSSTNVLAYVRNLTTPQTPFNAGISLTLSVTDSSEAAVTGNGTITTVTPAVFNGTGSGIAFDSGNAFRYGRLKLANAHGSELLDLPLPMEAQYWNGTAFVTNTADNCTTIAASHISLANYQKNLAPGETSVSISGRFNGGKSNLKLTRPGAGNNGSVDLTVNLGATGANQSYLQGKWSGTGYNQNPGARATFGIYKNPDEFIYMREIY